MNQAPESKASGCTSNIPDSTRNLKPMIKEAIFSQTMSSVIGPVANKPSGVQPIPSLTSRSNRSNEGAIGEAASRTSAALERGSLRCKNIPTTIDAAGEMSESPVKTGASNEKKSISEIFKDRLLVDAKTRRKEMVFADQMEMRDP